MPYPVEPWSALVRLSDIARQQSDVRVEPDAEARDALARRLGARSVKKLRLEGRLLPEGARDWRLEATLGATVVQACVVSLKPVTTRIDEPLTRRYLADMPQVPEGAEIEMPDEEAEPLPSILDLGAVMEEALALAMPAFPRAEGVAKDAAIFGPPGADPLTDEAAKPLAGLARLMKKDDDAAG